MDANRNCDRSSPPQDALSVSDVTSRVKEHLESRFSDVWITGEISNLARAASGHVYFSLKDEKSLLRAVAWRGSLPLLAIEPADGLQVVCHGRIELYPPRGTYQLTVDQLHAVGTGALEARLQRLRGSLEREGLFAPDRKRPVPRFPRRIAVVTSPTGAAIADFLKTLLSRWQAAEVILVPSRVQGAGAAEELAAALRDAARLVPSADVIALVRGGGSLEDLWSFNEEVLVRAISASPVPVVSGVGHEIDVTLADLAADLRGLTPTDAAVRVSPDGRQVAAAIEELQARLHAALLRRIDMARERIRQLARSRPFADPDRILRDRTAAVVQQAARLRRLAMAAADRGRERLSAAAARLEAGSPLRLLDRGWSVAWIEAESGAGPAAADRPLAEANRALRSILGVRPDDVLVCRVADGTIWSRVERTASDAARN